MIAEWLNLKIINYSTFTILKKSTVVSTTIAEWLNVLQLSGDGAKLWLEEYGIEDVIDLKELNEEEKNNLMQAAKDNGGYSDSKRILYALKAREKAASKNGRRRAPSVEWIQCMQCKKWHVIPTSIDPDLLPKQWYCSMNTWDLTLNTCDSSSSFSSSSSSTSSSTNSKNSKRCNWCGKTFKNTAGLGGHKKYCGPSPASMLAFKKNQKKEINDSEEYNQEEYQHKTKKQKLLQEKDAAIGTRLRMYWPAEKTWYRGLVVQFDEDSQGKLHKVLYEDGEALWHDLQVMKWNRIVSNPNGIDQPAARVEFPNIPKVSKVHALMRAAKGCKVVMNDSGGAEEGMYSISPSHISQIQKALEKKSSISQRRMDAAKRNMRIVNGSINTHQVEEWMCVNCENVNGIDYTHCGICRKERKKQEAVIEIVKSIQSIRNQAVQKK